MDYVKIIQQAWNTTWRYKALWVFGILLALASAGGGGGSNSGVRFSGMGNTGGEWNLPSTPAWPGISTGLIVTTVAALCGFILVFTVLATLGRYISQTALIRMVDEYDETGKQRTVQEGFQIGWSRSAWRLFLLDLLVGLVIGVGLALIFVVAAAPLLVWVTQSDVLRTLGTVAAIGLILLAILFAIVVGTVVNTLLHFVRRFVILEGQGVFEALSAGATFVWKHLKDVALMWLLMVGINLGVTLLMIPVVLLLMTLGGVIGGLPALIIGGLISLVTEGAVPWIVGGSLGLLLFLAVVMPPSLFLGGVYQTFDSSVWTLTYRELRALEPASEETPATPALPEVAAEESGDQGRQD